MRKGLLLVVLCVLLTGCAGATAYTASTPTPTYHLTYTSAGIAVLAHTYAGSFHDSVSGNTESMRLDGLTEDVNTGNFVALLTIENQVTRISAQGNIESPTNPHPLLISVQYQDTLWLFVGDVNSHDGSLSGNADLATGDTNSTWALTPVTT